MNVDDPPDPISFVFSTSLLPHSGHFAFPNTAHNLLFIQFFKDMSASILNHSFSHLLQRKQVPAPPNLRPSQARQSTAGRTPPMRTNLGSAPTKISFRAPLHQRHVAHFFCAIGMSSCAISLPFAFSAQRSLGVALKFSTHLTRAQARRRNAPHIPTKHPAVI